MKLKNIFIIDDDTDILILLKYYFKDFPDFNVKFFDSGENAITEALASPPDLVLLDVIMPKMSGSEVLKAFKYLPKLAKIPVVYFTASVQNTELLEYYKSGIVGVIKKPFDVDNLMQEIQTIWNKLPENI